MEKTLRREIESIKQANEIETAKIINEKRELEIELQRTKYQLASSKKIETGIFSTLGKYLWYYGSNDDKIIDANFGPITV